MQPQTFRDLSLDPAILRAVEDAGYSDPTPIQLAAIPEALSGRDVLGIAQTGTGKTAAFSLPMLQHLGTGPRKKGPGPRGLVLTPTRELALQVERSLETYGRHLGLRTTVVLGGVPIGGQIRAMRGRPDIVVATPGRLLDLIKQGHVRLDAVEILVLDEADRMLDLGFLPDVERIVSRTPEKKQTLFFSATMSPAIERLARTLLGNPLRVEVTPTATVADKVEQRVLFVERPNKKRLLTELLAEDGVHRVLVFARTRYRADHVVRHLKRENVTAEVIHSDRTQGARQRALDAFSKGKVRVLVATDIVARGIDVDEITHVINFDLPDDPESYVHRIGRTARAGAGGVAISFCDDQEVGKLVTIERLTDQELIQDRTQPFHAEPVASRYRDERSPKKSTAGSKKRSTARRRKGRGPQTAPVGVLEAQAARRAKKRRPTPGGPAGKRPRRPARTGR